MKDNNYVHIKKLEEMKIFRENYIKRHCYSKWFEIICKFKKKLLTDKSVQNIWVLKLKQKVLLNLKKNMIENKKNLAINLKNHRMTHLQKNSRIFKKIKEKKGIAS